MLTSRGGQGFAVTIDLDGFEGLELQRDPAAASWIGTYLWQGPRTPTGHFTVASLASPGFESYARVDLPPLVQTERGVLAPLLEMLTSFTATPDAAVFCLWEGYGGLERCPADVTMLESWARRYFVYRGPVLAGMEFTRSPLGADPEVICPEDRAWVLGTDTDLDWYFLGGSEAAIAAVERSPDLTSRRVTPADPIAP